MQKKSLYDIDEGLRDLLETAQDFTESTPVEEVNEWLANFEEEKGDRHKKLESIAHVRNEAIASARVIDNEIDRLMARKRQETALAGRMDGLIELSMRNSNETEIKTSLFRAKFVKNPPAYKYSDAKLLELQELFDVPKLKASYDAANAKFKDEKKATTDRVKAGEEVEGVEKTQGERLKIS